METIPSLKPFNKGGILILYQPVLHRRIQAGSSSRQDHSGFKLHSATPRPLIIPLLMAFRTGTLLSTSEISLIREVSLLSSVKHLAGRKKATKHRRSYQPDRVTRNHAEVKISIILMSPMVGPEAGSETRGWRCIAPRPKTNQKAHKDMEILSNHGFYFAPGRNSLMKGCVGRKRLSCYQLLSNK